MNLQHDAIVLGDDWFTANCRTFLTQDVIERIAASVSQLERSADAVIAHFNERNLSTDDRIDVINKYAAGKFKIVRWQQMLKFSCENISSGEITTLLVIQQHILKQYSENQQYREHLKGAAEKRRDKLVQSLNQHASLPRKEQIKQIVSNLKKEIGLLNIAEFMKVEASLLAAIVFIKGAGAIDAMLYPGSLPRPVNDAMQLVQAKFQKKPTPLIKIELKVKKQEEEEEYYLPIDSVSPSSSSSLSSSSSPSSDSSSLSVSPPSMHDDGPLSEVAPLLMQVSTDPKWWAAFAVHYVEEKRSKQQRISPPNSPPKHEAQQQGAKQGFANGHNQFGIFKDGDKGGRLSPGINGNTQPQSPGYP